MDEAETIMKSPRELLFFSALTAVSIASQGIFDVKKPTGQCAPISLMLLVVADSGERKTSSGNVFLDTVREFQREQDMAWEYKFKKWKTEEKIWEAKNKEIFKYIAKAVRQGVSSDHWEERAFEHEKEKPVRPRRFKVLYDDTTSEALMWGMFQDVPVAGLVSTEGDLRNKAFNDLSKQNSLWSGDPITVDRKTAESFELKGARLTVSFMTQPALFERYVHVNGEVLRGSGLWARFLVCQPISTQGYREINSSTVSWEHNKEFAYRIRGLLKQSMEVLETPGHVRQIIGFSPGAADLWVDVFNEIEWEIRRGGRFEGAGDLASKLADNFSRVAALLHVFEGNGDEISVGTLRFAIDFCTWCSDEFYRIFMPSRECEVNAKELLVWFKARRRRGFSNIRKNEILQYGPRGVRVKEKLDAALVELVEADDISIFKRDGAWFVDFFKVGCGY
ncbi:YfjI family protein [Pseudomonas sp. URMO17WK12:I2]|uniref:YfjI family protein n=1 Tax=Pseudomonas sp. URMO17WK12:I2 TaxID=1261623 RepID=UPI001313FCEF|nr:YfjI family protein [Pseudomonas sp. URMO17WK12:I2]